MKEIGGYFELEISGGSNEYHKDAIALNTGRNALEYILRLRGYKKVYIPEYYCNVMLEPVLKLNVAYSFYKIDLSFEFDDLDLQAGEAVIYINYFGLKDEYIVSLAEKYANLIIDNAQAFFSRPVEGIDTYYSCRKYFGVPDGGYVYANGSLLPGEITSDSSHDRYKHLVGRIDDSASAHYSDYSMNEDILCGQDIRYMSRSTRKLLSSIDYEGAMARRRENYSVLHNELRNTNRLQLPEEGVFLCYPFLNSDALKKALIRNKVYIATYWPNVLRDAQKDSFEYDLSQNLICLPIDQRYDVNDMKEIIKRIGQ